MRAPKRLPMPPERLLRQVADHPLGRGLAAARERAASELNAARDGLPLGADGPLRFRKWLGWKLYHVAARVNPEVSEP